MKCIIHFSLVIFLLMLPASVRAQRSDTASFHATDIIAPTVLAASGIGIHYFAHDSWDIAVKERVYGIRAQRKSFKIDDYVQYVPAALDLGLGLFGVEAQNPFGKRLVEGSVAYLGAFVLTWSGKIAFGTLRPSGANRNSFPSGHSSVAFTGAELVRIEYGWGWGAGAYALAASVAGLRIYNNRHWLSDVLLGAGVGILSANIGKWLLEPACDLVGISEKGTTLSLCPSVDPFSGSLVTCLAVRF